MLEMSKGARLETLDAQVERLVLEYAQKAPPKLPLNPLLSLQSDLAIESLSLVSLAVRLGDELGVDVSALNLEIGNLRTVGDLVVVARQLSQSNRASNIQQEK
jgi:acyl carrier protein